MNPAIDKTVAEDIALSAGGKGLNVARALKTLGEKPIAIGLIGGIAGGYIKRKLIEEDIGFDFSEITGETRTNLTLIDTATGRTSRIVKQGPPVSAAEFGRFKKKYLRLLKDCDYAIFSGRNARGLGDSAYGALVRLAKRAKVKTVVDTHGRPLASAIKARPFLVKPNIEEAERLLGRKLNSLPRIKEAVNLFHRRGVTIVVITMGRKGAVASEGKGIYFAAPPVVKNVNDVGCGDSFIAGFVFSMRGGQGLRECLRSAVAAGAANTLTVTPGMFKVSDFRKLKARIRTKAV